MNWDKKHNRKEAVEVLERRLVNVQNEQGKRPAVKSDGHSTLRNDQRVTHRTESIQRRKTKAEKAAEWARIHALSEAIGLLTGESDTKVETRVREQGR